MEDKIEQLEDLLQVDKETKIIQTKIQRLTEPGENYGSLILQIDITTKTPKGTAEIHAVVKTLPPNKEMQEMFDSPATFPKEISFYKTMVPSLQAFQRECGVQQVIDLFPKYYGSRLNLNGSSRIDDHAAIVLENMKCRNFVNYERTIGLDLEASKLVVTALARLHAVSLGFKLQKPDLFQTRVRQYLTPLILHGAVLQDMKDKYYKIINSIERLRPYIERLHQVCLDIFPPPPPREPWGSICHNDCWVNNIMLQVKDGATTSAKLVDFQIIDYGSPAKDLLFFLFSSVQDHVLQQHYDELTRTYYEVFVSILLELKCDAANFSFQDFERELNFEAKLTQFAHIVLMLPPIFAPKGIITDIAALKPTDIGNTEPTDLHKEKLVFIVEEFAKRNWI